MPTEEELIQQKLERRLAIEVGIYEWRLANYGSGILLDSARRMVEETQDRLTIRKLLNKKMETTFGARTGDWPFTTLIPSSNPKNKPYTVTIDGPDGLGTCTCPGFGYRSKCRHLAVAMDEAREKGLSGLEPVSKMLYNPPLEELLEQSIQQAKARGATVVEYEIVEPEPEEDLDLDELIK